MVKNFFHRLILQTTYQNFEIHHHKALLRDIITEETTKIPETGSAKAAPVSISGEGAMASCAVTGDPNANTRNAIIIMWIAAKVAGCILLNTVLNAMQDVLLIPDKIIYNQFQKALIHAANDYTTDRNGDYTNKFL
ncbi:unnamed protein product, partial [Vitis vinifera]